MHNIIDAEPGLSEKLRYITDRLDELPKARPTGGASENKNVNVNSAPGA